MTIDPGPRNTAAAAYWTATGVIPMKRLVCSAPFSRSRPSTKNITRPEITNPRLPRVLTGSRNRPPLTRSHQRETSPIACSLAAAGPQPPIPAKENTTPNAATAPAAIRSGVNGLRMPAR